MKRLSDIPDIVLDFIHERKFIDCPVLDKRKEMVIELRFIENKTLSYISKNIKVTPQMVKIIILRSCMMIRKYLNGFDPNLPIKDTILSTRAQNCLEDIGINIVSELFNFPDKIILQTRNTGKKTLEEIQLYLSNNGHSLDLTNQPATFRAPQLSEFYGI